MKSVKLNSTSVDKIKSFIKEQGITQEDFAEKYLDVTLRTLQNWFSQKTPITIEKLDLIQRFLGISVKELFGDIPLGYHSKKTTPLQTMMKLINRQFFLRTMSHYKRYIDWIHERIHPHPYPTSGYFCVFEGDQNNHYGGYYTKVSIFIEKKKNLYNTKFTIGYVVPIDRMRIDYGSFILTKDSIEITRIFIGNSITNNVSINDGLINEDQIKLNIITWISPENSTFVIHCESIDFKIENHGLIKVSDDDVKEIISGKHTGTFIFPKSSWHEKTGESP